MKKYPSIWQKIALISSAAVALLCTFLPWISSGLLGNVSCNIWAYPGFGALFAVLFFVAAATIITLNSLALGLKKDELAFGGYLSAIIGSGIMLLISIIFFAITASMHLIALLGVGFWFAVIAAIATLVFGILGLTLKAKPAKK